MKQLTEDHIEHLKKLANRTTSREDCQDARNSFEISGGRFDEAYWVGYNDSEIENARFILSIYEINY